jgi:ribosomal-protein-alanine N-acetyltransferase
MQFLLIGRDGTDPDALKRRLAARDAHVSLGDLMRERGELHFAVALLDQSQKMVGSAMVLEFASRRELDEWLKIEPYVKAGVWSSTEIHECRVGPSFARPEMPAGGASKPVEFKLSNGLAITEITKGDKAAYVKYLNDREIYDQTLRIPYPYTEADAEEWVNQVTLQTRERGRSVNWAIREPAGELIGGIGFLEFELGKSHRAEIGYWLAKPYWNRGIMTEAVGKVVEFGFSELGLTRITANVFESNAGSARVLEKCGFTLEGKLRKHYEKAGKIFDGRLYARLAGET